MNDASALDGLLAVFALVDLVLVCLVIDYVVSIVCGDDDEKGGPPWPC